MKAYKILCYDGWMTLMHADTRGRAIQAARDNVYPEDSFLSFRALRIPELDDKPFTWENVDAVDIGYLDEDGNMLQENEYINDCPCQICRGQHVNG
jgi:hypothetical protein